MKNFQYEDLKNTFRKHWKTYGGKGKKQIIENKN